MLSTPVLALPKLTLVRVRLLQTAQYSSLILLLGVAPSWRTELYDTCATPMTLDSYIDLVDSMGKFEEQFQKTITYDCHSTPAKLHP